MVTKYKKHSNGGMGAIVSLLGAAVSMYVGVNLVSGLNAELNGSTVANNVSIPSQTTQGISYSVGSPIWVLILGTIAIIGLGLAWYYGRRKYGWLGDEIEV